MKLFSNEEEAEKEADKMIFELFNNVSLIDKE